MAPPRVTAQASMIGLDMSEEARPDQSIRFSVSNDLKNIGFCRDRIDAICNEHDVPRKIVYAVNLSVDELLTNIITHGYRDSDTHEIGLAVRLSDNEIIVEIDSDGIPFDPTAGEMPDLRARLQERPIGGLGIPFVRELMDRFTYRRENGRNVLTLVKETGASTGV